MNILELRKDLDSGKITCRELASYYIERIKKLDKRIGAYLFFDEKMIFESADRAQKRIDEGKAALMTGIPVALKDNLCTLDMPTTCASKMLENYRPCYDATVVKRLRAQDSVFLGKVNMDEFAMGASTKTSFYRKTVNPYDENRVPGGSSGGSAAAVSAGLCPVALGSDTGGSVRQPAAFCGITGFRPTYGRVSRFGCVAFASSLDQIGPLANSALDCALLLSVISGRDENDCTATGDAFILSEMENYSLKGKRLGIITELMGKEIEEETKKAVLKAAEFYRSKGAVVEEVSLPALKHAVPAYYLISSAEASANLSRFDGVRYGHRAAEHTSYMELISKSRSEGFGQEVKRRIMLGSYALCSGYYDAYYKKAVALTHLIKKEYAKIFEGFDALLSPVSPSVAYRFDEAPTDPAENYIADICTVSAALAGLPSISTPCGYTESGLPIGLMITGKKWADGEVLALADAFEQEFSLVPCEVIK